MVKKYGLVALGITALALMGAGCGGGQTTQSNSAGLLTPEKTAADNTYNKTVDLELPDQSNKLTKGGDVDTMVKKVFNEVKVSSFISDFPLPGSTSVGYTTPRPIAQADFNALVSLLKASGYKIDGQAINDGTAVVQASNKNDYIIFTLELGKQALGATVTTQLAVDKANAENPDDGSDGN